jgi:hypothetical protein
MDNLQVHISPLVMKAFDDLDIIPIFNLSYSPKYNPIESVFSQVKFKFKRERLKKLANLEPFDAEANINEAFNNLQPSTIDPCIRMSNHLIRNTLD